MFALAHAREIGLPTQINPTVTRHNVSRLDEITLLSKTGADLGTRVETRGFAFPELEFGVRGLPL